MSYVASSDTSTDEEEKKQQESQQGSATSIGGGGSGVIGSGGNVGGSNVGGQAAQAATKNDPGSWTNLQQYLDANQEQAAKAGQDVAGSVDKQGQTAKNDIDSAASDFSNQVNANTVQFDPNSINSALTSATSTKAGGSLDPDVISKYQKQANASYNGPTDFTKSAGYTQAQNDVNNATGIVNQTRSEAGRNQLLNNQYSGASQNGYTPGENKLDQALLEGNQNAQQALQGVRDKWSGINNVLGDTTSAQNTAAAQAQATDAATAKAVQDAYRTASQGFQTSVDTQYKNTIKALQEKDSLAAQDLRSMQLTPEEAKAFGLADNEQTYGINDLSPYLEAGAAPTVANSATADQYAQAQALARLAGQTDNPFLPSSNASQAGTASGATFNHAKYGQDLAASKAAYDAQQQQAYMQWLSTQKKELPSNIPHPGGVPGPWVITRPPSDEAWQEWQSLNPYSGGNLHIAGPGKS